MNLPPSLSGKWVVVVDINLLSPLPQENARQSRRPRRDRRPMTRGCCSRWPGPGPKPRSLARCQGSCSMSELSSERLFHSHMLGIGMGVVRFGAHFEGGEADAMSLCSPASTCCVVTGHGSYEVPTGTPGLSNPSIRRSRFVLRSMPVKRQHQQREISSGKSAAGNQQWEISSGRNTVEHTRCHPCRTEARTVMMEPIPP